MERIMEPPPLPLIIISFPVALKNPRPGILKVIKFETNFPPVPGEEKFRPKINWKNWKPIMGS